MCASLHPGGALGGTRRRALDASASISGHGDGEALELGRDKLPFAQLKALLAVSGDAFITSTAANEAALESSELKGSVFTSHLVSGLRGAADQSGDRQVTLAELFRYAYERTVATTALTAAGAQHPSFKLDLSGQGELVRSTLSRASAQLDLPKDAERVVITDASWDQVVAEVLGGSPRSVALAPGRYEVRFVRAGRTCVASVMLTDGARDALDGRELEPNAMALAAKGEGRSSMPQAASASSSSSGTAGIAAGTKPATRKDDALRLCILGFKNLTRDPKLDYLGDALVEAIHTDFGASAGVRLLERGQVNLDLQEIEFAAGHSGAPDEAPRALSSALTTGRSRSSPQRAAAKRASLC